MTYIRTYVDVDIDMADIDTDDIIAHLQDEGYAVVDKTEIQALYEAKLLGNDLDPLLKEIVYKTIGRSW